MVTSFRAVDAAKADSFGVGVVQNFDGVAVEKLIVQCLAQRKVFLSRKLFRPRLHTVLFRGTRGAERISLYLR